MADMGSFFKEKQEAAGRGGLWSHFGPASGCILSLLDALERRILLARGRDRKKENNKMRKNGVEWKRDIGKRCCLTGCPDPNTELASDWSVVVSSWHGLQRQLFGNDGSPWERRQERAGPWQQSRITVKFCCPSLFFQYSSEWRRMKIRRLQQINKRKQVKTQMGDLCWYCTLLKEMCSNWIPSIWSSPLRLVCGPVSFHAFIPVQWDRSWEH